ncbi:MAG: sulfate adenylyltransferase [Candidatus Dormibacteraeota bacterium]|nr:sulfate adenylyltransferase [Candidatus Dormibacteraeota bacterium]
MSNKGFVVWFTGLSGAGKSTLAERLRIELEALGRHVEVLDGDEVRTHLSKGLGFSKEDRDTNIRRIGYAARLVARSGGVAITAAISPYQDTRDEVRGQTPGFFEVYVRCSIEELTRRDVKGLYAKALLGEIQNFTGVNDPYEAPRAPELTVDSEQETVEESLERILDALERRGHIWLGVRERLYGLSEEVADRLPGLEVGPREASDALMIGTGALSPLAGFMAEPDYLAVLENGRLIGGQPFTIPIVLGLDEADRRRLAGKDRVALWHAGRPVAVVDVESAFRTAPEREATAVYRTDETAHPGVRALRERGTWAIAGPVRALARPDTGFPEYDLTPLEVRRTMAARGWRTMVGFQTRNPVHRAHEYLQKVALESVDGLLLHPLVGETKADDIPAATRMRCYEALLEGWFPAGRTLLATNPAWMRYAGPKEAVFHALIRRNYGCTHFIVGRDHAGVGNYYDTYAAHRIFDGYTPEELGIEIIRYEHTFWCRACAGMGSSRTCPHGSEEHLALSGTAVRAMLASGVDLPAEFTRPEVARVLAAAETADR